MRLTQEQAQRAVDAARGNIERGSDNLIDLHLLDLLDLLRDTTARAEQAEIDADEMDRKMCVLVLEKQQAEKDRDALAAEVRAWRAFNDSDFPDEHILEVEGLMEATDASGALQRAKGGAA